MHTKYKLDIQCKLLIQRLNNHYIVNNNLTIFIRSNNEGLIVITSDVSRFVTLFMDR
jgi:hypothetical protein